MKWLALAGALAMGASSLFAQDSKALIDVLIKKGILTPDEAQQIEMEAKKAESTSKTTVGGKLYVDFSNIDATTASGTKVNPSGLGLDVKRFYFGVSHQFDNVWSAGINTDSSYSSGTGATSVFIKTAYIQAKLSPEAIIQAGCANMPWIPFDEDIYGFRYVENTLVDRLHFGNSADWGLHFLGKSGMVSYNLALVNGGGYHNPTRSKGMDVAGRVSIEPVKGLTFAAGGYNGKLGKDSYSSASTRTASRFDLLAAYNTSAFAIGAEYFKEYDWGYTASPMSDSGEGENVWGSVALGNPAYKLFARYDTDKPSQKLHPDMKDNYFNVGFQVAVMKGLDIALVYKHDKIDNPSSASQVTKYNEIGVWAQAAF